MENVKLRLRNDRLEARIPFANGKGPVLAKTIDGRRWVSKDKVWSYPLRWESATALRKISKELGVDLEMSAQVRRWGNEEKVRQAAKQAQKEAEKAGLHELVDLPLVRRTYPDIWKALSDRPFQTQGVDFMRTRRGALLADDPGLGKTLQTLATFVETGANGPILIIANKSAAEITWPNEIKKWLPEDKVMRYGAHIPKKDRAKFWDDVWSTDDGRCWVIMNPHWVRAKAQVDEYGKFVKRGGQKLVTATTPEIFEQSWLGVVADESHETLACSTGNAKKWSQQRQGLGLLEVSGPKISISGTPMRGKPENLFGQLQWLDPQKYSSYWNWAKKHFSVTDEGYGGAMVVGALNDEQAFYDDASDLMIRRDKSTVASDLPPKQYAGTALNGGDVYGVWLPMHKEQKKMYDHFVANSSLIDDDGNQLDAIGALAVYTRMKQLATTSGKVGTRQVKMPKLDEDGNHERDVDGRKLYELDENGEPLMMDEQYLIPEFPSNKYDWLCDWLEERDLLGREAKGKNKVIVASQFRQVIEMFAEDLKVHEDTESFEITGSVSAKERIRQQDEFQNNPDSPKIFFLQSKAGGTSLTLDMADDVIILDEMWDPDVQTQIEDRAHRLSRKHNVSIWYTRSLDTVEEYIGTTVEERNRTCRAVMDGSRGVDIKKMLIKGGK